MMPAMNKGEAMTQKEMILETLFRDGVITTFGAYSEIGCTRLPARIHELREEYPIGSVECHKENRFGKRIRFFVYYLEGSHWCPDCNRYAVWDTECQCECVLCRSMYALPHKDTPRKAARRRVIELGGIEGEDTRPA